MDLKRLLELHKQAREKEASQMDRNVAKLAENLDWAKLGTIQFCLKANIFVDNDELHIKIDDIHLKSARGYGDPEVISASMRDFGLMQSLITFAMSSAHYMPDHMISKRKAANPEHN